MSSTICATSTTANTTTAIATCSAFGLPYEQRWTADQIEECIELFQLNKEQSSQLLELRDRLADLDNYWGNGPFEVVRFVLENTCQGNVDIMEKRIRKCVEWRAQNQLDTILETYSPPNLLYRFPAAIMQGTDLQGDVLVVLRQGDPLGLLQIFGREELMRGLYWGNEFTIRGPWQRGYREKMCRRPKRATAVIDLTGLSRRHYHPSLILLVQKIGFSLQLHYPYIVKKVLVINAPSIFRFVWSLVKPFILPHLRALMEVATEAESRQLLQQYVDLQELPDCLVPGIGKGKPVPQLNPNWDAIGVTPPPTPKDWERTPLIYGSSNSDSSSYYYKHQDTMTSSTSTSSTDDSVNDEQTNNNPQKHRHPAVVKSLATVLLKGVWKEHSSGVTSVYVK